MNKSSTGWINSALIALPLLSLGACRADLPPPAPQGHVLTVADYDNDLGDTPTDTTSLCARRPPPGFHCLRPGKNLLGQCAEFNFCDGPPAGTSEKLDGGSICVTYETRTDMVFGGQGRSLRLDLDIDLAMDSFAGYVERLSSGSPRCPAKGPFNLDSLGVTHLTFWVRVASYDENPVELEIALKSAGTMDGIQTGQSPDGKLRLGRYWDSPCGRSGEWRKICIPLEDLRPAEVQVDGGTIATEVDFQQLLEINIAASRSASGTTKSRKATVWLDSITFESIP